jgi:hypothetical protein
MGKNQAAMRRNLLLILLVLLCVIVLTVGLLEYFSNAPNDSINTPNPSPTLFEPSKPISVIITKFEETGHDNAYNIGVSWNYHFTVVYRNNGSEDINDLTIKFDTSSPESIYNSIDPNNICRLRWISNESEHSDTFGQGAIFDIGTQFSLGTIKSGEEKIFYGIIHDDLADNAKIRQYEFTATLQSNAILLDKATIVLT